MIDIGIFSEVCVIQNRRHSSVDTFDSIIIKSNIHKFADKYTHTIICAR
jgi:hypothetical protein